MNHLKILFFRTHSSPVQRSHPVFILKPTLNQLLSDFWTVFWGGCKLGKMIPLRLAVAAKTQKMWNARTRSLTYPKDPTKRFCKQQKRKVAPVASDLQKLSVRVLVHASTVFHSLRPQEARSALMTRETRLCRLRPN